MDRDKAKLDFIEELSILIEDGIIDIDIITEDDLLTIDYFVFDEADEEEAMELLYLYADAYGSDFVLEATLDYLEYIHLDTLDAIKLLRQSTENAVFVKDIEDNTGEDINHPYVDEDGDELNTVIDRLPNGKKGDPVNHPPHYNQFSQEVIVTIKEWTRAYDGDVGYLIGNVLKYIPRAPFKHETPLEDIKKAKFYLDDAVKLLEKREEELNGEG